MYEEGRIQKRREHNSVIAAKIDAETRKADTREESKMKSKGLAQWTYEHVKLLHIASHNANY